MKPKLCYLLPSNEVGSNFFLLCYAAFFSFSWDSWEWPEKLGKKLKDV